MTILRTYARPMNRSVVSLHKRQEFQECSYILSRNANDLHPEIIPAQRKHKYVRIVEWPFLFLFRKLIKESLESSVVDIYIASAQNKTRVISGSIHRSVKFIVFRPISIEDKPLGFTAIWCEVSG